jgi:hypothetical protein
MELAPGGDLLSRLASRATRLSSSRIRAHLLLSAGVTHRDVEAAALL